MTWKGFFRQVYGKGENPFPYQNRLAEQPWPDALSVPTGLGKTAGVVLSWLYKRLTKDPGTPRRLVYCLPMRVLVEQVAEETREWLSQAAPLFPEGGPPECFVLMGGEAEEAWALHPERPAILIGTQDMLLSRALMRGYGMSRYAWPLDYALLNNDALWVFDEVQLMGAGLTTSAQLEGLRRRVGLTPARECQSLWLSATLLPDWLKTVDLKPFFPLGVQGLEEEDRNVPIVGIRLEASKTLKPASARLVDEKKLEAYASAFAKEVAKEHLGRDRIITLVFINQVERAQGIYRELTNELEGEETELLLVHSRFRPTERRAREERLRELKEQKRKGELSPGGVIVVSTQALEAGVDFSSDMLFTELAPWSPLVQRFGRCNRYGESKDAQIFWTDIKVEDNDLSLPYTAEELVAARERLNGLESASPTELGPPEGVLPPSQVMRRKDLVELFNTEPDLTGFDIDVSPYIRDADDSDVRVFWRSYEGAPPPDTPRPDRQELCSVPIGRFRTFVKVIQKRGLTAFVWDPIDRIWMKHDPARLRPGQTVMLSAEAGGYSGEIGFNTAIKGVVEVVADKGQEPPASYDDDASARGWISLSKHTESVVREAEELCVALGEEEYKEVLLCCARWHDTGKAHFIFANAVLGSAREGDSPLPQGLMAKPMRKMPPYERRGFRHELASALLWLARGSIKEKDLIAYLIASHHGKVRLAIRSIPGETEPPEPGRRFARGIWEGDKLPIITIPEAGDIPETSLSLEVMEVGDGDMGESWSTRAQRLLRCFGPFRLAWYEALLCIADRRASAKEREDVNAL